MKIRKTAKVALMLMLSFGCSKNSGQEDIEVVNKFEMEVQEILARNDSILNMDRLTRFDWEDLFIFKPYTSIDEINSKLGYKWEEAESTFINVKDDFNLLVFTEGGRVIKFARLSREHGDFSRMEMTGPFKRGQSAFVLKRDSVGMQPWLFIYEFPSRNGVD